MIHRRGSFLLDAIVALGLLTGVAMLLVVGRTAATRLIRQTDDQKTAVRTAERVLIDAAGAMPATTRPVSDAASDIAIERFDLPAAAPAGWKWVSVRVTVNRHAGEIAGLIRSDR